MDTTQEENETITTTAPAPFELEAAIAARQEQVKRQMQQAKAKAEQQEAKKREEATVVLRAEYEGRFPAHFRAGVASEYDWDPGRYGGTAFVRVTIAGQVWKVYPAGGEFQVEAPDSARTTLCVYDLEPTPDRYLEGLLDAIASYQEREAKRIEWERKAKEERAAREREAEQERAARRKQAMAAPSLEGATPAPITILHEVGAEPYSYTRMRVVLLSGVVTYGEVFLKVAILQDGELLRLRTLNSQQLYQTGEGGGAELAGTTTRVDLTADEFATLTRALEQWRADLAREQAATSNGSNDPDTFDPPF